MVMKMFCDECGKELEADENRVTNRIEIESKTGYKFQLLATNKDAIWNAGFLCIDCIKKLINESS